MEATDLFRLRNTPTINQNMLKQLVRTYRSMFFLLPIHLEALAMRVYSPTHSSRYPLQHNHIHSAPLPTPPLTEAYGTDQCLVGYQRMDPVG